MRLNSWSALILVASVLACSVRSAPLIEEVNKNITSELFEGDIAGFDPSLLDDEDRTLSKIPDDYSSRWKNGIVYYKINKGGYTSSQIQAIMNGMKMIEDLTRVNGKNCITFKERQSEPNYLNIYSGRGCWSQVGRLVRPEPQDLSLEAGGCTWAGTAAHEFLHALGFWHEQSRPDRDRFIYIDWNNIDPNMRHNFKKYETEIDTFGLKYDYQSIMHYNAYAFAIDRSKPTIYPRTQGISIGQREKLSNLDIQAVRKLYGCI